MLKHVRRDECREDRDHDNDVWRGSSEFTFAFDYTDVNLTGKIWIRRYSSGSQQWVRTVGYGYDANDKLNQITDFAGKQTSIQHNKFALPTVVNLPQLMDHAGRPTLATTVRAGRIFRIGYGYTAGSLNDQITVRRDSASSIPWTDTINVGYNAARRAFQFMDFGNKTTTTLFDAAGRAITDSLPTSTTPASKVRKSIGYSAASQVLSEAFSGSAATALNRTYGGYDATDRIGTILRPTGTLYPITRYHQYDAMGRLGYYEDVQEQIIGWDYYCDEQCQEWGTPPDSTPYYWPVAFRSATYSYDKVANRTDLGATISTGNRMSGMDGWAVTYDDAGYMTKRKKGTDSLTYTWNALGQLVQVTSSVPSYTVTYGYDGLGRRVRKTVNGTATRYLVEGDRVLVELDNSWLPAAKYSYYPGVDRPHAMVRAGKRYYFAQDGQGNVTGLLDSVGTVVQQYDYTPYGEALPGSGSVVNPYQYKGREWDAEARLYFMRARYYDPQMGRFISEDPIGLAGGLNPTAFVASDPVNHVAPDGLRCVQVYDRSRLGNGEDGVPYNVHWVGDCWGGGGGGFLTVRPGGFSPGGFFPTSDQSPSRPGLSGPAVGPAVGPASPANGANPNTGSWSRRWMACMAKGASQIGGLVAANGAALYALGRSYAAEATGYLSRARLIGALAGRSGTGCPLPKWLPLGRRRLRLKQWPHLELS